MSKGESDWLLLPSSPKGEIVGIMIHMLYLMATHSSQMINYSAAKFTHFHAEKRSHTFMQRKVPFMQRKFHALSCREKFLSCRENFMHFHAEKSHAHSCREKRTLMGNI